MFQEVVIVRKELLRSSGSVGSADQEQRILSYMNCLHHPNIVELLGSYTLGATHSLFFPLAQQDLKAFLSTEQPSFPDHSDFLLALCGLASAVHALHSYELDDIALIGCHHDLKPQNVLVDNKKFLLADFGLSTFKKPEQGSKSYFKQGQGFYFAPECEDYDNNFQKKPISRASDIWSLGCIIAEILAFIVRGADGVRKFEADRKVEFGGWYKTYTFHHGNLPNPGVEHLLSELRTESSNASIEMVVHLVRDMLRLQPCERPKAPTVLSRLRLIALKYLYDKIESEYLQILHMGMSVDTSIERERLRCWAWVVGVAQDPEVGLEDVPQHFEKNAVNAFDQTYEALSSMIEELNAALQSCGSLRPIFRPLQKLNDAVVVLLPETLQQQIRTRVDLQILKFVDPEDLRLVRQMTETDPRVERLEALAAVKYMHVLSLNPLGETNDNNEFRIDKQFLRNWRNFGKCDTATLITDKENESKEVLIEWMAYDATKTGEVLMRRANAIARLLCTVVKHSPFSHLHCEGFFHDPSHHAFALVFDIAQLSGSSRVQPISLHEVIERTKDVRIRPSLGELFGVATQFAEALLEYHKVDWLHKNISSHSIIFRRVEVAKGASTPLATFERLYITGFNHSRPDKPDEYSVGFSSGEEEVSYHDPLYKPSTVRYRAEFDYFSLGLVLLEIGIWKTIRQIFNQQKPISTRVLQREFLPLLGPRMGSQYRDATSACLSFSSRFGNGNEVAYDREESISSKLVFERDVVEKLKSCHV